MVGCRSSEVWALSRSHPGPMARTERSGRDPWVAVRPQPPPFAGDRVAAGALELAEEKMAGDWIPMRVRLWEADEVIGIALDLNIDEYAVVGRLLKLWGWASEMSRDGRARNVTDVWIDRYVDAPGFARALEKQGWLDLSNGGMAVVDFERWNSENARKRLKNTDRQRRLRGKGCRASCATNALPEKRREEKSTQKKTTSSSARTQTDVWGSGPIQLDTKSRKWLGVTEKDLAGWTEAYPACDVAGELKRALEWCLSNGARGRKKAYRAFLTRWLSKSQDRGGSQPRNPYGPQTGHNPILDRGGD